MQIFASAFFKKHLGEMLLAAGYVACSRVDRICPRRRPVGKTWHEIQQPAGSGDRKK
jgi:hypothetical protein